MGAQNNLREVAQLHLPHLDALRALAILLVLLFHLDVPAFALGYLGVDLFFLLSGFLMTYTMMRDRAAHGRFRVGAFVVRRFKRIVPSLLVTIVATFAVAYFLLSPEHLVDAARQGVYAQFFVSNIYFYDQAGYFALENSLRPLLHTWSLSVEEQFYAVFALVLFVANYVRFSRLLFGMSVAGLLILLAAYWIVFFHETSFRPVPSSENLQSAIFFLTPFRIAQFLVGGLVALHFLQLTEVSRGWWWDGICFGLLLCGVALLHLSEVAQLLSTLVVLLFAAPLLYGTGTLNRMGELMPVRALSRISYQVYLVHWPLIVFWKYWTFEPLTTWHVVALFILSVALGWGLFVGSRLIAEVRNASRRLLIVTAAALLACLALEIHAISTNGAQWRIPQERRLSSANILRAQESAFCEGTDSRQGKNLGTAPGDPLVTCVRKRDPDKEIYVVGDSHARHLLPGLSTVFPDHTIQIMYFTSCPVQSGFGDYVFHRKGNPALTQGCIQRNKKVLEFFSNRTSSNVVLHQYSGYAGEGTAGWYAASETFISRLQSSDHKVVWLGPVVYPGKRLNDCVSVPNIYSDQKLSQRCQGDSKVVKSVYSLNETLVQKHPHTYVSLAPFFCPSGTSTSCRFVKGGVPLFRDKHHLTPEASIALLQSYRKSLEEILE